MELKKENESLNKEMQQYEECDPARLDTIRINTKICKVACDRWVDNLYQIEDWIKKQRPGISGTDLHKQFPILEDLEYFDFATHLAK